jgi:regulator of extracellular matrix RemA (YlzA/DUF370 family)
MLGLKYLKKYGFSNVVRENGIITVVKMKIESSPIVFVWVDWLVFIKLFF